MKNIGIIGIGTLTLELAFRASKKGYHVSVHNPKGNSLVREIFERTSNNITLTTLQQSAEADLIILFVPKHDLKQVISLLPDMCGRIVVHTSGLIFDSSLLLSELSCALTYPITASLLPKAHIVKLFKPQNLESYGSISEEKNEIFYIADHHPSAMKVKTFLNDLDFTPMDLSNRLILNDHSNIHHLSATTEVFLQDFKPNF